MSLWRYYLVSDYCSSLVFLLKCQLVPHGIFRFQEQEILEGNTVAQNHTSEWYLLKSFWGLQLSIDNVMFHVDVIQNPLSCKSKLMKFTVTFMNICCKLGHKTTVNIGELFLRLKLKPVSLIFQKNLTHLIHLLNQGFPDQFHLTFAANVFLIACLYHNTKRCIQLMHFCHNANRSCAP